MTATCTAARLSYRGVGRPGHFRFADLGIPTSEVGMQAPSLRRLNSASRTCTVRNEKPSRAVISAGAEGIMSIICRLRGHLRDNHRAWHDGIEWRSSCTRCGAAMIRDEAINRWRLFDRERDFSTQRKAKPDR